MPQPRLYAILSDVHANEEAFRVVLRYVRDLAVDAILCLGDLVGYGQGAATCVQMARKHDIRCIQGNHDAQVKPPRDTRMRLEAAKALDHAAGQLDAEQMSWLGGLSEKQVVDGKMVMVHGALTGRDDYILKQTDADHNLEILRQTHPGVSVCFFGHTHLGMVIGGGKARTRFPDSTIIQLERGVPYLINPGSVGQPRDGLPKSSFALLDTELMELTIIRVDYDIETEQQRMRRAGLPDKLWQRLALGR